MTTEIEHKRRLEALEKLLGGREFACPTCGHKVSRKLSEEEVRS